MIPFDRPSFEFVSFIEFANATEDEYTSMKMESQNEQSVHLEIFRKSQTAYPQSNNNYWFLIEFGYNFSSVILYMKNHIDCFLFTEIDSIPCLKFTRKNNNLIPLHLKFKQLKEKNLLHQVALYYSSHQCPDCIKSYFKRILNPIERIDTILGVTEKTVMNVLNACPGNIHVVYQIRPGRPLDFPQFYRK